MPVIFTGSRLTRPGWHPSTPYIRPPTTRQCRILHFLMLGWPASIPSQARCTISTVKSTQTPYWRISRISTPAGGRQNLSKTKNFRINLCGARQRRLNSKENPNLCLFPNTSQTSDLLLTHFQTLSPYVFFTIPLRPHPNENPNLWLFLNTSQTSDLLPTTDTFSNLTSYSSPISHGTFSFLNYHAQSPLSFYLFWDVFLYFTRERKKRFWTWWTEGTD